MDDDRLEDAGYDEDGGAQRMRRPDAPGREELATGGRLLLGWTLILVAVVLLGVGWYGVSGTPRVERQMAYLVSGGLGGMLAGIIGIGFLVSSDVRRDRERLGRVEAAMLELREMLVAQSEVLKELHENGSSPQRRRPRAEGGGRPRSAPEPELEAPEPARNQPEK